jgi:hypothetical protein
VEDTTLTNLEGDQVKAQAEASIKKGEEKTPFTPSKSTIDTAGKKPSTKIGSPIQSIMSIQSNRWNPSTEVIFIEDLMPISVEEMPHPTSSLSRRERL